MRLKRIDLFRLFAIYLIVWAHTQYFDGIKAETTLARGLELGVILIARSSIQFFFIASGYFLGAKILDNESQKFSIAWKYTKKLLLIFVFWCVIYALENLRAFRQLAIKDPITLLFEGSRLHLWFLVSLILVVWLFALWPMDKKGKSFLIFGAGLFAVGLLGGAYSTTPIGFTLDFNTRDGIFFGTLFFAIGVLLHIRKPQVSPSLAWGLYLSGGVIFALEMYLLWANWSANPITHDYLLGSLPYGIGVFLVALTAKHETKLDRLLAPYGKYVLGIYVSHLLLLDLFRPIGAMFHPLLWGFMFPLLVFSTTLLAVILLSKTPLRTFLI